MTQAIGGLAEFLPLKVTAELIVDLRDGGRPFSRRKEWPGLFGTDHVDEDEVLAADEREGLIKMLGGEGVAEIDKHDEERPPRETLAQGDHELLEVGRDRLGLEGVEGVADEVVVVFPVPGADEAIPFVGEADESEEVALPLSNGGEDEGAVKKFLKLGRDEVFAPGGIFAVEPVVFGGLRDTDTNLTRAQTRVIDDDVDLLGALDLKGAGGGTLAAGGRFPVDVNVVIAGLVVAQLLEVAAFPDLADGAVAVISPHQEEAREALALGAQVGVNAHFGGEIEASPQQPQAPSRGRLDVEGLEKKTSPPQRDEGILDGAPFSLFEVGEASDEFSGNAEVDRGGDAVAERGDRGAAIGEGHRHGQFAALGAAEEIRHGHGEPREP